MGRLCQTDIITVMTVILEQIPDSYWNGCIPSRPVEDVICATCCNKYEKEKPQKLFWFLYTTIYHC